MVRRHPWALTSLLAAGHDHATGRRTTMEFGRRNRWTTATFAFAFVLAIGAASTAGAQQAPVGAQGPGGGQAPAGAQGRGGGRGGAPYTPAAGAKDLRAVLFNWMWHQGM